MPGFRNLREYALSFDEGRQHVAHFRKVPSQASTAGQWVDLSMAAGNPLPQYYAAEPLVADTLDGMRGIFCGADRAPSSVHLAEMSLTTPTAGLVGQYMLLDYLAYYPFIDGDSLEPQPLDSTVTLPRYADGDGVMAMLVAQAPTAGGGVFTFNYVDADGVARTSPPQFCGTVSTPIASIVTSQPGTVAGQGPFLVLNGEARGIRRPTSVTFSVANGGLAALVLVKPILDMAVREINTTAERQLVRERAGAPRVFDGAYLGLVMQCAATVAAGTLTGHAKFYWN